MTGTGKKSRNKIWIIVIITLIILLAGIFLPLLFNHCVLNHWKRCHANLKVNGVLCMFYAEENNGFFPDNTDYIKQNSGYMQCLREPVGSGDSYFLIPGLTIQNSPKMPLMIEKISNHKEQKIHLVVLVNGSTIKLIKEFRNYSELLPEFSGITPEEKKYLRQIFAAWDKGNFSFRPESPFRKDSSRKNH